MTPISLPYLQKERQSSIIIALDFNNRDKALSFVDKINPENCKLKIGKIMFTLFGPKIIHDVHQRGFSVFLDLKFHDIPNVTARSVVAAAELGVWMINVHASGGERMMTSAREALLPYKKNSPLLIAVTVLTSIEESDLQDFGITLSPTEYTKRLALLTKNCGLDGVVCSAQEASILRSLLGQNFKLITPGIRLLESNRDDQRRVMTPEKTKEVGADYMVIGRLITQSSDPIQVLKTINSLTRKNNK